MHDPDINYSTEIGDQLHVGNCSDTDRNWDILTLSGTETYHFYRATQLC